MFLKVPPAVSQYRIKQLVGYFQEFFKSSSVRSVLDVGCGHAYVTRAIQDRFPEISFVGVDVKVRDNPAIPVRPYDGKTLPFEDKSFDAVMMIDVLHHTNDPVATLRECVRVARQFVLVKDHIADSMYDDLRLRFMDWFGNRPFGIPMTYEYMSSKEWEEAFAAVGVTPTTNLRRIQTCPPPFYYLLDHDVHFIASLAVAPSS